MVERSARADFRPVAQWDLNPTREGNHVVPPAFAAEIESAAQTMPRLRPITMTFDVKIAAHDKSDGTFSCSNRLSYRLAASGNRTRDREIL